MEHELQVIYDILDILCDLLKVITPINIPDYIKDMLKEFVENWAPKRRK